MLSYKLMAIVPFLAGLLATWLPAPLIAKKMREIGIVGVDVHKLSKPSIPDMGGIAIIVGIAISIAISSYLFPEYLIVFLTFLSTTTLVGLVGVFDDLYGLHPVVKPMLTALASLPLFLSHTYSAYPIVPLVGRVRLTLIYPVLVPFGIAVSSNVVNMMDVLNGAAIGTCLSVAFVLLLCSLLFDRFEAIVLSLILLGCLIAFHNYNRYPAKIFLGDTGSLTIGASIGAISIIGGLEAVGVVALLPHIMNAFYILAGLKRLCRHELWPRPIRILDDEKLAASDDPEAPITLVRMILASGPLREPEVVRVLITLTVFCGVLAIITGVLMVT